MASATFDTLHAAKALTAAGFETQQAEAITDTIREAFTESVATKADIAEVKANLAEVKSDLMKWMVGALIAQGGVIVALLKLLPG